MKWIKKFESVNNSFRRISQSESKDMKSIYRPVQITMAEFDRIIDWRDESLLDKYHCRTFVLAKDGQFGKWTAVDNEEEVVDPDSQINISDMVFTEVMFTILSKKGKERGLEMLIRKKEDDYWEVYIHLIKEKIFFWCDEMNGLLQALQMIKEEYI